jgi:predicted oxidoreductase (fatty acid repression mutant protein)
MKAPATISPATIITVEDSEAFWIVVHHNNKATVVDFRYKDQGEPADSSVAARDLCHFLGLQTTERELEEPFTAGDDGFEITSPQTNKVFSGDTEGEALEALLKAEPDAILQLSSHVFSPEEEDAFP